MWKGALARSYSAAVQANLGTPYVLRFRIKGAVVGMILAPIEEDLGVDSKARGICRHTKILGSTRKVVPLRRKKR
jgi:hypothetical protein